jgi:hypothetical protein
MATTKESEVELVKTFYASFGDISTTKAWNRPNLYNLIKWRDTLFNLHNGLDGIDVFLVGGFAEYLHNPTNPLTWDVDVCFIVDESIDYKRIKTILDDSLKIALDIGILLDQKAVTPYVYEFFQKLWTGNIPEDYDNNKMIFFKNFKYSEKWINGVQIYGGKSNKHWSKKPEMEVTNPYDGLYKVVGMSDKLINKVIDKFNGNIYIGKDIDLRNSDFNFIT